LRPIHMKLHLHLKQYQEIEDQLRMMSAIRESKQGEYETQRKQQVGDLSKVQMGHYSYSLEEYFARMGP